MDEPIKTPMIEMMSNVPSFIDKTELIFEKTIEFQTLMMMYNAAVREIKTKFEILNDDLAMKNKRNPIESISQRIKSPMSITSKLRRRGLPVSAESIRKNLNDVAGVRVVCSFVDDIYQVAEMLANQSDITVIETKDYIKKPKPNGYRSYHMIIEVPIFFSDCTESLRVEVQFRTIAMDLWASLEHTMKYKKNINEETEIHERLKNCATVIAKVDEEMLSIRQKIDESADCTEYDFYSKLEKVSDGFLKIDFF